MSDVDNDYTPTLWLGYEQYEQLLEVFEEDLNKLITDRWTDLMTGDLEE